jgi:hypothetical protein
MCESHSGLVLLALPAVSVVEPSSVDVSDVEVTPESGYPVSSGGGIEALPCSCGLKPERPR